MVHTQSSWLNDAAVQVLGPLILSCLVGVCMSHAAYMLRDAVSATFFTIVGILCKVRVI